MIERALFSKRGGDGEKEEGEKKRKCSSSVSSALEEARGGAGKVTPFASVSNLKDRLSKNVDQRMWICASFTQLPRKTC